jgi:hypothetical protein
VGHARKLTGKLNGPIAQLIQDGYLTSQVVAIRRLCDKRKDAISLPRALVEIKSQKPALDIRVEQLLRRLDSCEHVCELVNHHIAHTANPARQPNVQEWNLGMKDLVDAQKAICKVAITLDRHLLQRNGPSNLIPVPQFDIMEDLRVWVPDDLIDQLWKFWHAHTRDVDAWPLDP